MKKICYMGFNEDLILELIDNNNFELSCVITQDGRLSKVMLKLLELAKIPCYSIQNKNDLLKYKNEYDKVDYILSCCFGIIIPDAITENYKCFNMHPGDLRTNRGAYPLVRNILNNDKEAVFTLHRIGNKVDTGVVLGEYRIPIEITDDNITILDKLNTGIDYLLKQLYEYDESKKYEIITDGTYYKKVTQKDILIAEKDNLEDIKRKIRAQKSYGGALAQYKDYLVRISEIVSEEKKEVVK